MLSSSRDNWERLVAAVVKREEIWELCHQQSRSPSICTTISSDDLSQQTLSNFEHFSTPSSPLLPSKTYQVKTTAAASNNASSRSISKMLFSGWYRRRKSKGQDLVDIPAEYPEVYLGQLERFSLHQLQVATDKFSGKNLLGRGGFAKVYKGRLIDGTLVAVKRLHTTGGELQFQTEIQVFSIMAVAVHSNLLRLRGFCMTHTERLLVYPYMVNGSLASCLRERPPLDWGTRKRIALGTARGLSYLHDHCDPKIIHRDVKAANILLDEEFEAVVGDFSLAKQMNHNVNDVTTVVRGTIGHIAPEYLSTGKTSEKTDVFAYGLTLLELITGQRAFDLARLANDDDLMLLVWVKGLLKEKKLEMLVDPDLQNNYVEKEVEQLIQVALLCTQNSALGRPKMSEVAMLLKGDGLADKWDEWVEEPQREVELSLHPTSGWIFSDSIENLDAVELSGPR